MNKKFIILTLIILSFSSIFGQSKKSKDKIVHFGASLFYAKPTISFGDEYAQKGFELYFANEKNETIKWNYSWDDKSTSGFPIYPNIYLQLDYGNHLFVKLDMYALWFTNKIKYRNSVDAGTFFGTYSSNGYDGNDNTSYDKLGYNELKISWTFLGNSIVVGYSFFKTKAIQPYVFGGVSLMYLMQFEAVDIKSERQNRINMIMANIDTYKQLTINPVFGGGLKYRSISLDVSYQFSENVDTNKPIYIDDSEEYVENFTYFGMVCVSLKVNLLSRNLNKSKLKNK